MRTEHEAARSEFQDEHAHASAVAAELESHRSEISQGALARDEIQQHLQSVEDESRAAKAAQDSVLNLRDELSSEHARVASLQADLSGLRNEYEAVATELSQLRASDASVRTELEAFRANASEAESAQDTLVKLASAEQQLQESAADLASTSDRCDSLEKEVTSLKARVVESETAEVELAARLATAEKQAEEQSNTSQTAADALARADRAHDEREHLESLLEALRTEHAAATSELQQTSSHASDARAELEAHKSHASEELAIQNELRSRLQSAEDLLAEHSHAAQLVQDNVASLNAEVDALKSEHEAATTELTHTKEAVVTTNAELEALRSQASASEPSEEMLTRLSLVEQQHQERVADLQRADAHRESMRIEMEQRSVEEERLRSHLQADLLALSATHDQLKEEAAQDRSRAIEANSEMESLRSRMREAENANTALRSQIGSFQAELEERDCTTKGLRQEIAKLQAEGQNASESGTKAAKSPSSDGPEKDELLQAAQTRARAAECRGDQLKRELDAERARAAGLESRASDVELRCERLTAECAALRARGAGTSDEPKFSGRDAAAVEAFDVEANGGLLRLKEHCETAEAEGMMQSVDHSLKAFSQLISSSAMPRKIFFGYFALLHLWVLAICMLPMHGRT
eukprot:TRINITY_DN7936_c0_g2_i2.p1 TRINITY_DN7936_c0_g2~~TRINITY_DN7936_c0_g2_i2.p1  ORF type:complete len:641 (-),score=145.03 TRINITY_DN7936_c0_g2_i2:129-2051(-)